MLLNDYSSTRFQDATSRRTSDSKGAHDTDNHNGHVVRKEQIKQSLARSVGKALHSIRTQWRTRFQW